MNVEQTTKASEGKPVFFEVFWARSNSIQYVFKDGKYAQFADYKFYTDHPEHIKELKHEIAMGHPSLYQEDGKETVQKDADPLAGIKAKLREEILAEERARIAAIAGSTSRDMGFTEATKINPLSTADVSSAMADSTGNPVADFIQASGVNPAVAGALAALGTSTKTATAKK